VASETRLYVGGLPQAVTVAELTQRFTPFGAVTNAQLVPPRGTALPRPPLAFVTLVTTPPKLQRCLKTVRTRIAPATMRASTLRRPAVFGARPRCAYIVGSCDLRCVCACARAFARTLSHRRRPCEAAAYGAAAALWRHG
jgi:hypothetical protein